MGGHCYYRVCDTGGVCIMEEEKLSGYLGLVFAAALCPVEFPGIPCSGYVVEALIGSSMKFYFFLVWRGVAVALLLWGFLAYRRIKWHTLDGAELEEGVFVMKGPETGPCVRLLASGDLCAG